MLHPAVRDLFYQSLPRRPFCSDDKTARLIRVRDHATRFLYIQHNAPAFVKFLIFDLDEPGAALAWDDAGLPPPTWSATDPESGTGHLCYALRTPVGRTQAARIKPLRYLAAVESAYCARLSADRRYTGLITKNPLHALWRVWCPANDAVYDLSDLADYVELDTVVRLRPREEPSPGTLWRNVTVFDELRTWAYSAVREYWAPDGFDNWKNAVRVRAQALNQFQCPPGPLPNNEIQSIAKSVAKWVWRRITPTGWAQRVRRTHTPEIQAMRGLRSGEVRRQANEEKRASARLMYATGMTQREIAAELSVNQSTISHWLSE